MGPNGHVRVCFDTRLFVRAAVRISSRALQARNSSLESEYGDDENEVLAVRFNVRRGCPRRM